MTLRTVLVVGCLLLVGRAQTAAAQQPLPSCAAADSMLPHDLKGGGLKIEYDKFTDTTLLRTKTDTRIGATMTVAAAFLGERPMADSIRAMFLFVGRNPQVSRSTNTADLAHLSAESPLYLLLDEGVRLTLSGASYTSAVSNGMGITADLLEESLDYPLSFEQLLQIASAKKVEVKSGRFSTKLANKVLEGSRDLVRYLLCEAAPTAGSS